MTIEDVRKEVNRIIRNVNMRLLRIWLYKVTDSLGVLFMFLLGFSPVLLWLLFVYTIVHFIVKWW